MDIRHIERLEHELARTGSLADQGECKQAYKALAAAVRHHVLTLRAEEAVAQMAADEYVSELQREFEAREGDEARQTLLLDLDAQRLDYNARQPLFQEVG